VRFRAEDVVDQISDEHRPEASRVSFIITGPALNLESITEEFAITPSYTHKAGDLIFKFKDKRYEQDMWKLTSPVDAHEPIDAHLTWLVRQLTPHYEYIKSLKAVAEIYIYCGYTTANEQSSFSLSSEGLAIFSVLDIPMHMSIHSIL
jgi:hypothetical protein